MAGSVNKVILLGNLGRDPEIRSMQSGSKMATLSLATSQTWKDRNSGERRERTEWHRVVIFSEQLVRVAESYLRKGSSIYIEGELQTRKWTDQQGVEKYTTEVVLNQFRSELQMIGRRDDQGGGYQSRSGGDSGGAPPPDGPSQGGGNAPAAKPPTQGGGNMDDDIPF